MIIIPHWPGARKHLIMLAIAWVSFSILLGLFLAFDALESSPANKPAAGVLINALKTAGLLMFGGIVTYGIPFLVYFLIRRKR